MYKRQPIYSIRAATALIALAESDIRQAEKAIKKKQASSQQVHRSPAQTETDHTTHSDNLPLAPSQEEEDILQEFESAYANIPHPATKEPILYIEQNQEHEEPAINGILDHYRNLKDTLSRLADIRITLPTRIPRLEQAVIFQKTLPDYMRMCKRHLRTATRAKKALAEKLDPEYTHQDNLSLIHI